MIIQFKRNFFFTLIILVLTGCATEEEINTFSSLWENSFSGCGINCHSPDAADGTQNGPNMSSKETFHTDLVSKSATDFPGWLKSSNCDDVSFITPGNAAGSSLPASLIESASDTLAASGNCTTSYNLHVVYRVTINNADDLIEWINAGAAND